jgi:diguanylate cyclase (GGDEF)-like protein
MNSGMISFLGAGFNRETVAQNEHHRCVQRLWVNLFFFITLGYFWGANDFKINSVAYSVALTVFYGINNLIYMLIVKNDETKVHIFYRYFFLLMDGPGAVGTVLFFPEKLAFLSPMFLFLCIGVGIRYGKQTMFLNVIFVLLTFTMGVIFDDYWRNNLNVTGAIYVMILVVPIYFKVLIEKVEKTNAELHNLAMCDPLTLLGNRRALMSMASSFKARNSRENKTFGLFYFDLDNFKKVNDQLGHEKGDELLVSIAKRLKLEFRENDFIARIGGDEFVILADLESYPDMAEVIAKKIQDCVVETRKDVCPSIPVTTSIGVAYYNNRVKERDVEDLLALADDMLYKSKESGKGCYNLAD